MSRWNPDTHLLSLHGKPIWHAYGQANTDPTVGGIIYGHYLLTHNINPHVGDNKPLYQQVYESAHNKAFENGKKTLVPTKRLPESPKMSKEQIDELKNRNPLMPAPASKSLKRHVKQLDLLQEPCFASKHSITEKSVTEESKAAGTPHKIKKPSRADGITKTSETPIKSIKDNRPASSIGHKEEPIKVEETKVSKVKTKSKLISSPAVALSGKGSTTKEIEDKTMANAKTMASTGKKLFDTSDINKTKQDKPKQILEKTEKSKELLPGPITYDTVELERAGYEQPGELHESQDNISPEKDHANEINPTVFPAGFPF